MSDGKCDVLLVGAGPIGMEAAAALKHAGCDYVHIEAGAIGATIMWYSPGTQFFSSPERLSLRGLPFSVYPSLKATREDYLGYLRTYAQLNGLKVRTNTRLVNVSRGPDYFSCFIADSTHGVGGPDYARKAEIPTATGATGQRIEARRIVLAIGNMHWPKMLSVPGESNETVSHYLDEIHKYFGKHIVIVGARNSAAEAAIRLCHIGCQVTVCHRGEGFDDKSVKPWLMPEIATFSKLGRLRTIWNVEVVRLETGEVHLRLLKAGRETTKVKCDGILLLTGYEQETSLFERVGISLEGNSKRPVHSAETMETNVAGIYVIGTCVAGTEGSGTKHFIENSHPHVSRLVKSLGFGNISETLVLPDGLLES